MEAFNVQFVGEIEKNPELYNFTIPGVFKKRLLRQELA